jgi:rhamnose utilization protein RhaD (predicted bifunctional aldolase and dehydrogenase)
MHTAVRQDLDCWALAADAAPAQFVQEIERLAECGVKLPDVSIRMKIVNSFLSQEQLSAIQTVLEDACKKPTGELREGARASYENIIEGIGYALFFGMTAA